MTIEHGGNIYALATELGVNPEECLDFSANINPLGISDKVRQTIIETIPHLVHYPDVYYQSSRNFLANHYDCLSENIILGNGAVEIFYQLARAIKPKKALVLDPTFMEYEKAFRQEQTEILYHQLPKSDYSWSFQSLQTDLDKLKSGDVLVLCNPNNPTGIFVSRRQLLLVATYLEEKGVFLIVDEAFIEFLGDDYNCSMVMAIKEFEHLIVVRSLTKFYAIPGLRLGYAISTNKNLFPMVNQIKVPWTVNSLANALVPKLFEDQDYKRQTLEMIAKERKFLVTALSSFKELTIFETQTNYIFFHYHGGKPLKELLMKEKIFIRSCHNYRNVTPNHYRIAIRSRDENQILLEKLGSILS